jgi:hypothetical protein
MLVQLPNNDILEMMIETEVTNNVTWYSLALSVKSAWQTIEGTHHLNLNKMFDDVSDLIKDLESGRREIIIGVVGMPVIKHESIQYAT